MNVDLGAVLAAGGMFIGAVVWLVRLEGRIDVTHAQYLEIIRRLDRIEHAQDRERA